MQIMCPNHWRWPNFIFTLNRLKVDFPPGEERLIAAILRAFGFSEESITQSLFYLEEYRPILTNKMLDDVKEFF